MLIFLKVTLSAILKVCHAIANNQSYSYFVILLLLYICIRGREFFFIFFYFKVANCICLIKMTVYSRTAIFQNQLLINMIVKPIISPSLSLALIVEDELYLSSREIFLERPRVHNQTRCNRRDPAIGVIVRAFS